eukprot:7435254-Alexandrium_andersonii.AAC.1
MRPFLARNLASLLKRVGACPALACNPKRDRARLELTGPGARKGLWMPRTFLSGLNFASPGCGID